MTNVVLSLGTNLGDRTAYMRQMEREVGALLEPPLTKSSLMETEPVGTASKQEWFYNRLVRGGIPEHPPSCLKRAMQLRRCSAGRGRSDMPQGPRTSISCCSEVK